MVVAHHVAVAVGEPQREGQGIGERQEVTLAHGQEAPVVVVGLQHLALVAGQILLVDDFAEGVGLEAGQDDILEIVVGLTGRETHLGKGGHHGVVERADGIAGLAQPGLCLGLDKLQLVIAEQQGGACRREQARYAVVALPLLGRTVGGEHQLAGTGIGFEEEAFARVVPLDELLVQALAGPEVAAVQVEGIEGVDRRAAVVGVGQLFVG